MKFPRVVSDSFSFSRSRFFNRISVISIELWQPPKRKVSKSLLQWWWYQQLTFPFHIHLLFQHSFNSNCDFSFHCDGFRLLKRDVSLQKRSRLWFNRTKCDPAGMQPQNLIIKKQKIKNKKQKTKESSRISKISKTKNNKTCPRNKMSFKLMGFFYGRFLVLFIDVFACTTALPLQPAKSNSKPILKGSVQGKKDCGNHFKIKFTALERNINCS